MRDGCRSVPRDRFLPELVPGRTHSLGSYDARLARPCRGTRSVAGSRPVFQAGLARLTFRCSEVPCSPHPTPATLAPTRLRGLHGSTQGGPDRHHLHHPYRLDHNSEHHQSTPESVTSSRQLERSAPAPLIRAEQKAFGTRPSHASRCRMIRSTAPPLCHISLGNDAPLMPESAAKIRLL